MTPTTSGTHTGKKTNTHSVYETLRNEILTLVLRPGQHLDEIGLAERFGMSRSPIREALIRLAGEHLVVTLPNRSTIVAPIEIEMFPKYVAALDIAQRINTRLAATCRTDDDLTQIEQRMRDFESAVHVGVHLDMSQANKAFHLAIAAAGKNPYFYAFYEQLLNEGQRMLHLHFDYLERSNDAYLLTDEHDLMLQAIRDRDADRAEQLAHDHTRQFQQNFLVFLTENYTENMALQLADHPAHAGVNTRYSAP
ncbi:GntR family transcriptional regulator [Castellaniella hirudinis]|uniref:GntR family transcriptional regulator n=1 Tax=Castellaniella hirudinis TaxID=1144617 RepID=UPI0039C478DF